MKKLFSFFKGFFALTLVLIMTIGSLDMVAFAFDNATFYIEDSYVNPLTTEENGDEEYFEVSDTYRTEVKFAAADSEVKAMAIQIRDFMIARNPKFTVTVATDRNDINNIVADAFQLAVSKDLANSSVAGDYLAWQYGGYSFTGKASIKNGLYNYTLDIKVPYYTTSAQEKEVTTAVTKALAGMKLDKLDDYGKIKAIYDYICKKCDYDNSSSANNYTRFSAYGAIINGSAVCQGYSTLLYRMLEEAGYDSKIVTNETHAWNIVRIDDFYYNLDVTWDDSYYNKGLAYRYFLKCNEHFTDHIRGGQYNTRAFNNMYPMGEECYIEMLGMTTGTVKDMLGNEVVENIMPTAINKLTAQTCGFTVAWNKVGEAEGYQVQYSKKADFKDAIIVNVDKATTLNKTITGCAAGTKYYVRVRAYDRFDAGNLLYGDWTAAKTVTTAKAPAKATVKSALPIANGVKVTWEKVSGASGYQIQYAKKSDFTGAGTVTVSGVNTVSKSVTGLTANTKYYVRVRAYVTVNGTKVYGTWSAAKNLTTPKAPGKVTINNPTAQSKAFTVKWKKVTGATGYQVQYAKKSNFSGAKTVNVTKANATSSKLTGAGSNVKYYVRVRAYKTVNGTKVYGAWSTVKNITTKK